MRYSTPVMIAATLLIAAPAAAQDNTVTATNDAAAAADVNATDPLATNDIATDPANGLATDTLPPPATTEPVDMNYGEPADDDDDGRFPWGLLGLLGLAGLIPRKPAVRRHDGAI